jgi:hypothetical protein
MFKTILSRKDVKLITLSQKKEIHEKEQDLRRDFKRSRQTS